MEILSPEKHSMLVVDLAREQNLAINFFVHDIVESEVKDEKFDLIYDSHCYHCIVFDSDRKQFLTNLKSNLAPNGVFILDTMVFQPEMKVADHPNLRFDQDYILWHGTSQNSGHGIVEVDGKNWCAQRRIYPKVTVLKEIEQLGLKIVDSSRSLYRTEDPITLRLVLMN